MNPIKFLAELVVDDLDPDGTVAISEKDVSMGATTSMEVKEDEVDVGGSQSFQSTSVADVEIASESETTGKQALKAATSEEPVSKAPAATVGKTLTKSETTWRLPKGDRWAVAKPGVDLTGHWQVITSDEFKQNYDKYLTDLGQPLLVRSVALGIIGRTREETRQTDHGKSLLIRGQNLRGVWDRTLVASGTDTVHDEYEALRIPVMTADSEQVEAESWWDEQGTTHVSWLRGVTKYGGGAFESRRYLEDDGDTYVCESIFHPNDETKEPLSLTWRFRRTSPN